MSGPAANESVIPSFRLKLRVGRFEIHRMDGPSEGNLWIRNLHTGEGGGFPEAGLEAAIGRFFDENF
jgi:hypothetical protein